MPGRSSGGTISRSITNSVCSSAPQRRSLLAAVMRRSQRGAILAVTAIAVVMLAVTVLAIVDFGRVMILREQAQTAADAASLAASLSGVMRMVKVNVYTDRGEKVVCSCDDSGCSCWCEGCGITVHTVTGLERDLIDNDGWTMYCDPPCSCSQSVECWFDITDRWVVYDPAASRHAAESFLTANTPGEALSWWLTRLNVHAYRNDPYYPSVTAYARAVIQSLFPGLFNAFPDTYGTDVCSQGDTFYKDPRSKKWVDAPPDACWKD
ncbi:MAG: TadE/TadG family type IV pilus assembly protein [Moorellaceae bacterium]